MKTEKITRDDLAALPLDKVLISACCESDGVLKKVGHIDKKLDAFRTNKQLLYLGVASGQADVPSTDNIVSADTLATLATELSTTLDQVYGTALPLPLALLSDKYKADNYHPLKTLNSAVQTMIQKNNSGYILIQAEPYSGKSSWALNWYRESIGQTAQNSKLPSLSGWFFARRYSGQHGSDYLNEAKAMQTLISTARRRRKIPAKENKAELFSGTYRHNDNHQDDNHNQEELFSNFSAALEHLAESATKDNPLILLLDGADELYGIGENTYNYRKVFPDKLPHQLPENTFLVILSRPGSHLTMAYDEMRPIARIVLDGTANDDTEQTSDNIISVNISSDIIDYFHCLQNNQQGYANPFKQKEIDILTNSQFQQHIIVAAENTFGYLPELIAELMALKAIERLPQLKQWETHPNSLPKGIYSIRARELLGLYRRLPNEKNSQLIQVLATLSILKSPLTVSALAWLLSKNPNKANSRNQLIDLINQSAHLCLSNEGQAKANMTLSFNHKMTAELTLAFWLLWCNGKLDGEGDNNKIAEVAKAIGESHTTFQLDINRNGINSEYLSESEQEQAIAELHNELTKGLWQFIPNFTDSVKPLNTSEIKPYQQQEHQSYAMVWGVYHCLCAGKNPLYAREHEQKIQQALDYLLHAGFLQSMIRLAPEASKEAIAATYIAADSVVIKDDKAQKLLRHNIEAQLLQWHHQLANGFTHVGGLLWNTVGGLPPAERYAPNWKAAIDTETLICKVAGTPSYFDRIIEGCEQYAISDCGNWLVTSANGYHQQSVTKVWDLRQGNHRIKLYTVFDFYMEDICISICLSKLLITGIENNKLITIDCTHHKSKKYELYNDNKWSIKNFIFFTQIKNNIIFLSIVLSYDDKIGFLSMDLDFLDSISNKAKSKNINIIYENKEGIGDIDLEKDVENNMIYLIFSIYNAVGVIGFSADKYLNTSGRNFEDSPYLFRVKEVIENRYFHYGSSGSLKLDTNLILDDFLIKNIQRANLNINAIFTTFFTHLGNIHLAIAFVIEYEIGFLDLNLNGKVPHLEGLYFLFDYKKILIPPEGDSYWFSFPTVSGNNFLLPHKSGDFSIIIILPDGNIGLLQFNLKNLINNDIIELQRFNTGSDEPVQYMNLHRRINKNTISLLYRNGQGTHGLINLNNNSFDDLIFNKLSRWSPRNRKNNAIKPLTLPIATNQSKEFLRLICRLQNSSIGITEVNSHINNKQRYHSRSIFSQKFPNIDDVSLKFLKNNELYACSINRDGTIGISDVDLISLKKSNTPLINKCKKINSTFKNQEKIVPWEKSKSISTFVDNINSDSRNLFVIANSNKGWVLLKINFDFINNNEQDIIDNQGDKRSSSFYFYDRELIQHVEGMTVSSIDEDFLIFTKGYENIGLSYHNSKKLSNLSDIYIKQDHHYYLDVPLYWETKATFLTLIKNNEPNFFIASIGKGIDYLETNKNELLSNTEINYCEGNKTKHFLKKPKRISERFFFDVEGFLWGRSQVEIKLYTIYHNVANLVIETRPLSKIKQGKTPVEFSEKTYSVGDISFNNWHIANLSPQNTLTEEDSKLVTFNSLAITTLINDKLHICPYYQDGLTLYDSQFIDDNTLVAAGAIGDDVAVMVFEHIVPPASV